MQPATETVHSEDPILLPQNGMPRSFGDIRALMLKTLRLEFFERRQAFLVRRQAALTDSFEEVQAHARAAQRHMNDLMRTTLDSWHRQQIPELLQECAGRVARQYAVDISRVGPAALSAFEQWIEEDHSHRAPQEDIIGEAVKENRVLAMVH